MKSRTSNGAYAIHPMTIAIPLGAFFLALLGDIATWVTRDPFWLQWSYRCAAIGIFFMVVAAIPGVIQYFSLKGQVASELAASQMLFIIAALVMFTVDLYLRGRTAPFQTGRLGQVIAVEVIGLVTLALSLSIGEQIAASREGKAPHSFYTTDRRQKPRNYTPDQFVMLQRGPIMERQPVNPRAIWQ